MAVRTGLLPEHDGVAAPTYDGMWLSIPALEALRMSNRVTLELANPLVVVPRYQIILSRPPVGLVLRLIVQGANHHRGLRLEHEPPYPGELRADMVSWWERAAWLPCPACGASLVWYEAAYVPGYRVCSALPHHHARVSGDGTKISLVKD